WQTLSDRADVLRAAWPDQDGLPAAFPGAAAKLALLGDADLPRLIGAVNWFLANPESGLLVRQVPVEGVDTKWIERHVDLVRRLVTAMGGAVGLGLRVEPRRFRVRVLDGGVLTDFTAPTSELAGLEWSPTCVLLVENRDSMAPLADLPGVVAVHAQGLAAPELAVVGWIARSRVLYWGDLDTHGLRILGLVRQVLPGTESLLMDRATLDRFSRFTVTEPAPFRGEVGHLTPGESQALRAIRDRDLRLEQERIPWDHATATITNALIPPVGADPHFGPGVATRPEASDHVAIV
ncbi:MAG: Wadjet anti-phage system protein JetD domain-containing protein, partial [Micropruina sp.]